MCTPACGRLSTARFCCLSVVHGPPKRTYWRGAPRKCRLVTSVRPCYDGCVSRPAGFASRKCIQNLALSGLIVPSARTGHALPSQLSPDAEHLQLAVLELALKTGEMAGDSQSQAQFASPPRLPKRGARGRHHGAGFSIEGSRGAYGLADTRQRSSGRREPRSPTRRRLPIGLSPQSTDGW